MKLRHLVLGLAIVGVSVGIGREASAYDESSAAVLSNTGFQFGLGPVFLIPSGNRPLGFGLDAEFRYGIGADPVIIAPGVRVAGYAFSGRFVGIAMPIARLTLPLGPFAPFITGGVGGGTMSNPTEGGVALMGGGGFMIHFGRVFALGAEASYQTVTSTEFKMLAIGPSIQFGL